jgi:uncharacterized RDD family membrane protein YckC
VQPPEWHQHGPMVPPGGPFYGPAPFAQSTVGPAPYGPPPGWYAPRWEYAGRLRRLIAAFIDGFVVNTVSSGAAISLYTVIHRERQGVAYGLASFLIHTLFTIFIIVLPQARWGQTLGKRAMDIRVVRVGDGGAISYGQAVLRELVFAPINLILTLTHNVIVVIITSPGILDPAWVLWDGRGQALHDKVARTVVMKSGPGIPNPYKA